MSVDLRVLKDVLSYARLMAQGNRVRERFGQGDIYPRPILLLHGFLGTRAVMLPLERFLRSEGTDVLSLDLGVLNYHDIRYSAFNIHKHIERICHDLDIQNIDIVAHSMGGLIGLYYIKKLGGHHRVRRLITLGAPFRGTWAAWVAVATIGFISPAGAQMTPESFFLQELHTGDIPPETEVYAIEARNDFVVPLTAETIPGIRVIHVNYGHTSLIFSEEVQEKIREILTLPEEAERR